MMSGIPSLSVLVTAISNAVLEAQEKIEAAQLGNLMSYFHMIPGKKGFSPLAMKINLPSLRPDASEGATDCYHVPYLSVVPYSALRIKQMEINFDVSFTALGIKEGKRDENDKSEVGPTELHLSGLFSQMEKLPDISVDMGAIKKSGSGFAHIRLSIESVDIPEGAARLINELIKSNQAYEPTEEQPVDK